MRKTLRELPVTLDDTYFRILQSVDKNYESQIREILTLIALSKRPLRLGEILEFIAFNTETKSFDEEKRFIEPLDILDICSSLVIFVNQSSEDSGHDTGDAGNGVDKEDDGDEDFKVLRKELQFAHYSVKEFLISERTSTNPFHISESYAHTLIAERCVRYLLSHLAVSMELTRKSLEMFPFLEYAGVEWYNHAYAASLAADSEELNTLIIKFFDSSSHCCFHNWLKIWDPDKEQKSDPAEHQLYYPQPLYYSSLLGLFRATNDLVTKGVDVSLQGGYFGNALQAASHCGYEAIVQLLLANGADVNMQGGYFGNALQAASEGGHQATVQVLLENGADVNAHGGLLGTALLAASSRCHEATVLLLLAKGADINAMGSVFNPLAYASFFGDEAMVRLLLDKGADVYNDGGGYRSAIGAAREGGLTLRHDHESIVQLLSDYRINEINRAWDPETASLEVHCGDNCCCDCEVGFEETT